MKANRKFKNNDEDAVSAVIGVILMVAITVAIAATVYVYVSGMIGGSQEATPTISCNPDNSHNKLIIVSADSSTSWSDITITNDTAAARWALYSNGGSTNSSTTMPDADVIAGDYILVWGTTGNVKITFKYDPTNSLIGSWNVFI